METLTDPGQEVIAPNCPDSHPELFRINTTANSLPSTRRSGLRPVFLRSSRIMRGMPLHASVTRPRLRSRLYTVGLRRTWTLASN